MSERPAVTDRFVRTFGLRAVVIPAARLLQTYFRARVFGDDRIPRDRPVIYVGKHPRSYLYLETMLLGLYAFWDADRPPFRVLEAKGTSLHRTPILGWIRRNVNAIPATAEHALDALAHGESLLIFPGGTRELYGPRDQLQWHGRSGFADIAIRAGAPVVPFAIVGADRQHPARFSLGRRSIWLPPFPLPVALDFVFGRPLPPPVSGPPSRTAAAEFAARVETATRDLLAGGAAARRGEPAMPPAPAHESGS